MNPDIQNKIDEAASKHCLKVYGCEGQDKGLVSDGFKSGASFVQSIMQDEIERFERELILSKVRENDTKLAVSKEMETLRSFVLGKEIQSLKDENKKFREALGLFEKELTIGSDGTNLKCTCSRENCHSLWLSVGDIIYRVSYVHSEKLKALTQKAEE